MAIEFEKVTCNLCGSNQYTVHLVRGDLNTFLPGMFQLVKCSNCGLVYQNPRPTLSSWTEIYPLHYDQYQSNQTRPTLQKILNEYGQNKKLKAIRKFCDGGNICDIGCSTGDFLATVQNHPEWVAFGVEPNRAASNIAHSRGLHVTTRYFEANAFPDIQFNVVTMWNVIEHLSDPLSTLKEIYRRLTPGGFLIFTTPNLDSIDQKIFKEYWIGYELPRHFYVFSTKTVGMLLAKTGFKLVNSRCFFGSFALTMSSARFYFRAKYPRFAPIVEKVIFSNLFHFITAPLFWLMDRLKISSPITYFAQKIT